MTHDKVTNGELVGFDYSDNWERVGIRKKERERERERERDR